MARLEGTGLLMFVLMLFLIPGFICGAVWWLFSPVGFWQLVFMFIVCVILYFVFLVVELGIWIMAS